MAYSRITGTRNGAGAIDYARGKGKGHNNKKVRNMVIGEVNLLPESVAPYEEQMQRYWNKAAAKNKNQVRRIVQSFSRRELNPDATSDIQKANEIGIEFAQRAYPGHQAIVFTQIDGESGLIHNHVIVNNVNMETGYGCNDFQTKFQYVRRWTNRVAGQYFELDTGQNTKDKTKQNERRKRQENEQIREENRRLPPEKRKSLKYIWKDDLKERISLAADAAFDRDYFVKLLKCMDVSVDIRKRKDDTEYIVYTLNDEAKRKQENAGREWKAKGHKLGTDYDLPYLDERFKEEKARLDEMYASANRKGKQWMRDVYREGLPKIVTELEKFDFGYYPPKEHEKWTFNLYPEYVQKKPAKKKAETLEAVKTEEPVTEESVVKQDEKKPLLWKDVTAEQLEPTEIDAAFEKMSMTMKPSMPLAAKEPEKVQEAPKAAPVKKEAEKPAAKVPDKQETKQPTRPKTAAERFVIQQMMKRQAEEKKAKAEAQRAAFQKDERRLPHIDWSKGKGHNGMEF